MKYNYMVKVAYDGTNFFGWAKQSNLRTIQGEIEEKLENLFNEKIKIFASGRTDKSVHALDQCFNFKSQKKLNLSNIKKYLNLHINDIFVKQVKIADNDFSARFSIIKKTYLYIINNNQFDVFKRNYEFQYNHSKINIKKLKEVKKFFIGEKDFKSFTTADKTETIRKIESISISVIDSKIFIKITGSGFLRNMVRMILATMIRYSEGKINQEQIKDLFDNPKKGASIYKLDGCGLYLFKTYY